MPKKKFKRKSPQDFNGGVTSEVWNYVQTCHKEIKRLERFANRKSPEEKLLDIKKQIDKLNKQAEKIINKKEVKPASKNRLANVE